MIDGLERRARDPETGKTYTVPQDMTYKEWEKSVDEKYGVGTLEKHRKMAYNRSADQKQYERYVKILGKNAPATITAFQNIKYGDDWEAFKAYSRSIKSGELSPLADFDLYKTISSQIDEQLVGITTINGVTITGKSKHFIARVIGSVEQRRNGVEIADIIDAITNPVKVDPICNNKNGKSQRFKGKKCYVTINPDTGVLIQANPHKGGK